MGCFILSETGWCFERLQCYCKIKLLRHSPVAVGSGKRLFAEGNFAGSFELVETRTSPGGVIIANYRRTGGVKTGSFGN